MTWYFKTRVSMCDRMESASRGSKSTDGLSPSVTGNVIKMKAAAFFTRVAIYMDKEICKLYGSAVWTTLNLQKCFHFQEKISVRYFGVYDSTSWLRAGGEKAAGRRLWRIFSVQAHRAHTCRSAPFHLGQRRIFFPMFGSLISQVHPFKCSFLARISIAGW